MFRASFDSPFVLDNISGQLALSRADSDNTFDSPFVLNNNSGSS